MVAVAQPIVAPLRFACVEPNLYRGSYPRSHNIRFLQRLGLKTILSLTPVSLEQEIIDFAKDNGIQVIHLQTAESEAKSKKKRGIPLRPELVQQALNYMIDGTLQPMYVHCLNGSQVTSLVVACLRKISYWSMSAILDEFVRYSEFGTADQKFIEDFHANITLPVVVVPWLWKRISVDLIKKHPSATVENDESLSLSLRHRYE